MRQAGPKRCCAGASGTPAPAPGIAAPAPNLSPSTICSPSSFRFWYRTPGPTKKLQPPQRTTKSWLRGWSQDQDEDRGSMNHAIIAILHGARTVQCGRRLDSIHDGTMTSIREVVHGSKELATRGAGGGCKPH